MPSRTCARKPVNDMSLVPHKPPFNPITALDARADVFRVWRPAALEDDTLGAMAFQTLVDLGEAAARVAGDQADVWNGRGQGERRHRARERRVELGPRDQAENLGQRR